MMAVADDVIIIATFAQRGRKFEIGFGGIPAG